MTGIRKSNELCTICGYDNAEESEEESEILEESPCGRWLKRREQVEQRDVPGIDIAHLAMDTEDGVEVVWNEVQFSERKNYKLQEYKIQRVFENLTHLQHPNIIKFHQYWTDTHNDKPRVIFITEYMSSGSLKQFLKRTKHNIKKLPFHAWKKWCCQILSALSYLHSCCPPIVHGNLTCDTIFIQHNGLLKIGSVAPDMIHHHVKTCHKKMKNKHFIPPEYAGSIGPAFDIYSFGVCALEMAALELHGTKENGNVVTEEHIQNTVGMLDDAQQKDFILKCLSSNPDDRPTARELLFHPLLFEVHSLKLLAAHFIVQMVPDANISEVISESLQIFTPDTEIAAIIHSNPEIPDQIVTVADIKLPEKLEKFVEDVRNGIYHLTAYKQKDPPQPSTRPLSPELTESVKSITPEPVETEARHIVNMMCNIRPKNTTCELMMTILLRMEDKMNRQLTCSLSEMDSSSLLSEELVYYGLINEDDQEKVEQLIEEALNGVLIQEDGEDNAPRYLLPPNSQLRRHMIPINN